MRSSKQARIQEWTVHVLDELDALPTLTLPKKYEEPIIWFGSPACLQEILENQQKMKSSSKILLASTFEGSLVSKRSKATPVREKGVKDFTMSMQNTKGKRFLQRKGCNNKPGIIMRQNRKNHAITASSD
eukprot:TRINITY_DN8700_c0_g1_i2.p1 TRINITY_DN8700_c0_g1~~TRINITY_DN8700_c0_g1_i2.p1  ORF type:complete len:130 (-),score=10.28 TRINITY_DN8700_c0_g1_i2:191-580(-)